MLRSAHVLADPDKAGGSQLGVPALGTHPEAVLALVREVPGHLVQAPGKGRQRPSRLIRQQEAARRQLLGDVCQAQCIANFPK